ncbi:MAG TPA: hypothetical protein VHX17_12060 [Candidatus Cybelea sp.]|nr:hypothetical protein [Candidatus Cybelea sp.]
MRRLRLAVVAIASFAGGCAVPATPNVAAPATRAAAKPAASSGSDFLYVAESGGNYAYAFTYPDGKLINKISSGIAGAVGLCSDSAGNVYVTSTQTGAIVEYAHGASSPSATFYEDTKKGGHPNGCSVDPTTGNLAVADGINNSLAIFTGPSDFGTYYDLASMSGATSCGFDDRGNLFVDGPRTTSGSGFVLAELPKGAKALKRLELDKHIEQPGTVAWDGTRVTVGAIDAAGSALYRLTISGTHATVVGTTPLGGEKTIGQSAIYASHVIAPYAVKGEYRDRVGVWSYPAGGKGTSILQRSGALFYGVAISTGSPLRVRQ